MCRPHNIDGDSKYYTYIRVTTIKIRASAHLRGNCSHLILEHVVNYLSQFSIHFHIEISHDTIQSLNCVVGQKNLKIP